MQRTDEWIKNYNTDYFDRQFAAPYRSTVAFCNWLEELKILNPDSTTRLLDVGTGKGANIFYMANRLKGVEYVGVDINPSFVKEGNEILKAKNIYPRCQLEVADVYNFDKKYVGKIDGIISYQTLSWLPDFRTPMKSMASLNPNWIGITSLFYDGNVNCKIEIDEYNHSINEKPKKTFYNIYSLSLVKQFMANLGYNKLIYIPFEIDIDIPKPDHTIMGTYTEKLENGGRIQRSGPLLMNWYFILALKE